MTEIEVKILEINRESVEEKLRALGARKTFDDEIHAVYYDIGDNILKKTGKALRLRRQGDRAVVTLKLHAANDFAKQRTEHEVEVCGFEDMRIVLESLGYTPWLETQKHRTSYLYGDAHIELDRYCGEHNYIPEFLEIEGNDTETIWRCAEVLGFSRHKCLPWDISDLIEYYAQKEPDTQDQRNYQDR